MTRLPRARTLFASVLVASWAIVATAAPASAIVGYAAHLTGEEQIPGPGTDDGYGVAQVNIYPIEGHICVFWSLVPREGGVMSGHIHGGPTGVAGPVVVELPLGELDYGEGNSAPGYGSYFGCVTDLDEALLRAIMDEPAAYYVDVHTEDFEDGAMRGQLGSSGELAQIDVRVVACPHGREVTVDYQDDGSCRPVVRHEDIPPGVPWDVEPIGVDLEIRVHDGTRTFTLADSFPYARAICIYEGSTCRLAARYAFITTLSAGPAISQLVVPDGYEFEFGTGTGEVLTAVDSTVTLDLYGGITDATLYDMAVASPAPTLDPAPTADIRVTPPPTSTTTDPDRGDVNPAATMLAVWLFAGIVLLVAGRRSPHRRR